MPMRDARFGQFADPSFGASLSHSTPGSPGVLPTPDAAPSASAMPQAPARPSQPALGGQLGPGLMSHPGSNPGTMFLAEGGMIPDDAQVQDSGNAAPPQTDPFSMIQQALNYGRKKMGLPQQFYGSKPKPSNDADATNQAAADEGATGNLQDDDLRAFQNNQINNNLQPGEQGQWGDTTLEGKDKTAYLAEGGSIEDDTGVIPDGSEDQSQDQEQGSSTPSGGRGDPMGPGGYPDVIGKPQGQGQQGPSPQAAMAYLSGQGGIGPDIAQALERQVDPRGQMSESQRKLMAIAAAGSPDKAFQVMQHYRQKYNAYTAFAQAALQGAGGRPPNPGAAADALNKAYAHVPDGNEMHFTPTQGGFQVASRKIIPSKPAPSGGEDNSQREQPTQSFAEGGSVEGDDFNYETAGSETPSGSSYDRAKQASVAQDDYEPGSGVRGFVDAITPKRDENSAIQNYLLSFPMIKNWLAKDASFDKMVETGGATPPQGPDTTGAAPQQGQAPQPQPDQGVTSQRPMDQRNVNPMAAPSPRRSPEDPQKLGKEVADKVDQYDQSYKDGMHMIDQAYGNWVGQQREKQAARLAFHQHWMDNKASIEKEQTKGANLDRRANTAGGYKLQEAGIRVAGRSADVENQQTHGDIRAGMKNDTVRSEGAANREFKGGEGDKNRANRTDNATIAAKPSVLNSPEKMGAARAAVARPQPQAAQSGSGPAPNTPPPAGMEYQYSKSRNSWRLVPVTQ